MEAVMKALLKLLGVILLLAAFASSAGCGGEDDADSNECAFPCSAGYTCKDGNCVKDQAPLCDPACRQGFSCADGQCVEDRPLQCSPGCQQGFTCIDGQCVEDQPPDCDPPCRDGLVCMNGQCMSSEECEPECGPGFSCVLGQCVKESPGECGPSGNIANLKSCAEGPVDVTLVGATVTCVFSKGYFLQDQSGATEVYVGDEWQYDVPVAGQVINLHVTEYGSYKNQQEIVAGDAPSVTGTTNVEAMKLDISSGTLPSEELESRIIKGTGFVLQDADDKNLTIAYGSASNVLLRVHELGDLCVGATFDLAAGVVTQWDDIHRLQSFDGADIINVDTAGCGGGPGDADDSNWGFEEGGDNDPPADFEKAGGDFTAEWTGEKAQSGNNSCKLTWTSQDNQDLFQAWYLPCSAGNTVAFKVWVLDNDTAGRTRLSLEFYNDSYMSVGKEYSGGYSSDDPAWTQIEFSKDAPADTAFVRGFVRLYDVADNWDGDAVLYIDDWDLVHLP